MHLDTPHTPRRLLDLLEAYAQHLAGRGQRPRGVTKYRQTIRQVLLGLGGEAATAASLNPTAIAAYRDSRAQRCSIATVLFELCVTRSFCRWLVRRGLLDADPTQDVEFPKTPDRSPRALSRAQLRTLFAALDEPPARGSWRSHVARNRRAVLLLLFTGLRLSEAAGLHWRDVDLDARNITVRPETSKGGRARAVPIHPALAAELRLVVDPDPAHAVIARADGQPLRPKSFAHILERWVASLGLDITAHQLRHTFASELLRHGADLERIRQALGHRNLDTTQVYLRITSEHLQGAIDLLPARW
jgi:site-specific recombinase XerD